MCKFAREGTLISLRRSRRDVASTWIFFQSLSVKWAGVEAHVEKMLVTHQ